MKKIITLSILILASTIGGNLYAQENKGENHQQEKATKEEKKAREKAEEKAQNELAYQKAVQALNDRKFVLEADKVTFKRGETAFVTSNTNFILMDDNHSTVQVAFNTAIAGPNGIGGVTVDGNVSDVKSRTDKKGNIRFSFNVQGTGISAQVFINLTNGSNNANVTIYPNFNSQTLSLSGRLIPRDESSVFKGRSW